MCPNNQSISSTRNSYNCKLEMRLWVKYISFQVVWLKLSSDTNFEQIIDKKDTDSRNTLIWWVQPPMRIITYVGCQVQILECKWISSTLLDTRNLITLKFTMKNGLGMIRNDQKDTNPCLCLFYHFLSQHHNLNYCGWCW